MKKTIKAIKAGIAVKQRVLWVPSYMQFGRFQVVHDPEVMLAFGGKFAAVMITVTGQRFICIDDYFLALSTPTQQAVLEHEMGHVILQHQQNAFVRQWETWRGRVYQHEKEADAYAVMRVGKQEMIDALTELLRFGKNKEIERRINIIKEGF